MFKIPKTVSFSGSELARMKSERLVPVGVMKKLGEKADSLLDAETFAVTKRKLHAEGGTIHDYASLGIYWWPDPSKPDGLPYIRKDGIPNPAVSDKNNPSNLGAAVIQLSLYAYYTEDMRYAKKAKELIGAWFFDEETYMTPNAEYAQSIPGICKGRGIGIIDFSRLYDVLDGAAILEAMGEASPDFIARLRGWFVSYTDWLLTSENGLDMQAYFNNHCTWYHTQLLTYSLFTERPSLTKAILKFAYDRLHSAHIKPDGRLPEELSRTKSMNYSLFDLEGLSLIAAIAKANGVSRYTEPDGATGIVLVRAATDFIYDYIMHPDKYPEYKELRPNDAVRGVAKQLLVADALFPDSGYRELAEPLLTDDMLWRAKPVI